MIGFDNPVVVGARPARGGITSSSASSASFSPLAIPGLAGWYEADALALSDGATVASWTDDSGNGRHLLQATEAAKPTLQTVELNGLAVVRFDGVDDIVMSNSFTELSAAYDVFVVVKFTGSAGGAAGHITGGFSSGNRAAEIIKRATDDYVVMFAGGTLSSSVDIGAGWRILLGRFNGASSNLYSGGGAAIASGDVGSLSPTGFHLGAYRDGSNNFTGDIAAALLVDGNTSVANVNAAGDYLADKYGLSWAAV